MREEKPLSPIVIKIPTDKVVSSIVLMYKSEDKILKLAALDLAGYVLEAYNDKERLKKDIFRTFVTGGPDIVLGIKVRMQKQFPEETQMLTEIFGAFLFGGI